MLDNMLVILSQVDKEERERQFEKAAMLHRFTSAEVTPGNTTRTQIIARILHSLRRREKVSLPSSSVLVDAHEHR